MIGNALVFGAGYSGRAFGRLVAGAFPVWGTTRSHDRFAAIEAAGMRPLQFDGTALGGELEKALAVTTHLVVSAGPDDDGDPVLAAAGDAIRSAMPALRWIGYLSTVGVYGDHGGAWVDEKTPCRPKSRRSVDRVKAEDEWLALGQTSARPVAVLRLSGIYGPGRNAFVNLENGTAKRLVKLDQVFNRIHVDDIAGALLHLAARDLGGIYNVTDDEPAPPQDVVAYAAGLMGVEPPPETPFDTADLSPMARSFYGENKRVSNEAIKASGFAFRYPDYRTAFAAMWTAGDWRGEGLADARSPMRKG